MKNESKCVRAGYEPGNGEPRQIPIIQSTTFRYTSSEEMGKLFDLEKDPQETHNYAADADYAPVLKEMRTAMAAHLEERGETFVRDGKLQMRAQTMLYSPNFPKKTE